MANFGIVQLDWEVDRKGYELKELPEPKSFLTGRPGLHIVPRRGETKRYTARLREKDIFLELARMDRSPDGALAFVHKWGLLETQWPNEESVSDIIFARDTMEWSLAQVKAGDKPQIAKRPWHFPLDGEFHGSNVVVRVKSLLAFCWLELRQAYLAGGDFYQCANPKCGAWHRYPITGRPNKYCSEACKKAVQRFNKRALMGA
jgi:hypothetical protein